MAQTVLILGESGTGKSASLRNCNPETTAVVNPVGKPLPFKNKIESLDNVTDADDIIKFLKKQAKAGKKLLVVDDFQYILAVPYMNRIKETGWDKYNDFGSNYFAIIEAAHELPEDVVVAYLTHLETLDSGLTTVKLIGKLLREKITIEGLFTTVLRTGVNDSHYYFYTQNSGKDTVKSPMGMFPSFAIDNDLNYVADKIRNYYEIGDYKTDEEMAEADESVASNLEKPDKNGRRGRKKATEDETKPKTRTRKSAETVTEDDVEEPPKTRTRKTHAEVVEENKEKMEDYMEESTKAQLEAAGDKEEITLEEAEKAIDAVEKPELETPPRRTRKERIETAPAEEVPAEEPEMAQTSAPRKRRTRTRA